MLKKNAISAPIIIIAMNSDPVSNDKLKKGRIAIAVKAMNEE
jgi:hypothetical protein